MPEDFTKYHTNLDFFDEWRSFYDSNKTCYMHSKLRICVILCINYEYSSTRDFVCPVYVILLIKYKILNLEKESDMNSCKMYIVQCTLGCPKKN